MFQASLLACSPTSVDPDLSGRVRHDLGRGAWVDEVPGWLGGADEVFRTVVDAAPWRSHSRIMWDRRVDEPRLSTRGWADPPEPVPAMAAALGGFYGMDLSAVSANFYRDGSDSVAWHGDTAGLQRDETVVAIVSLGSPRRFLVRPRGGARSLRFSPAHGDLLVMGGTCQRTFDHAVPAMAHAGPRVSLMFREPGVF